MVCADALASTGAPGATDDTDLWLEPSLMTARRVAQALGAFAALSAKAQRPISHRPKLTMNRSLDPIENGANAVEIQTRLESPEVAGANDKRPGS
jgi:hypothetical protein